MTEDLNLQASDLAFKHMFGFEHQCPDFSRPASENCATGQLGAEISMYSAAVLSWGWTAWLPHKVSFRIAKQTGEGNELANPGVPQHVFKAGLSQSFEIMPG